MILIIGKTTAMDTINDTIPIELTQHILTYAHNIIESPIMYYDNLTICKQWYRLLISNHTYKQLRKYALLHNKYALITHKMTLHRFDKHKRLLRTDLRQNIVKNVADVHFRNYLSNENIETSILYTAIHSESTSTLIEVVISEYHSYCSIDVRMYLICTWKSKCYIEGGRFDQNLINKLDTKFKDTLLYANDIRETIVQILTRVYEYRIAQI